jgi:hypothetical protein
MRRSKTTKLWRKLMSVEAKLNQVLANQATLATSVASVLTAVQGIPGANTTAITAALAQIEMQVAAIQTTIGSDSSGSGASSAAGSAAATTAKES